MFKQNLMKRIGSIFLVMFLVATQMQAHPGHGVAADTGWHYVFSWYHIAPLIVVGFAVWGYMRYRSRRQPESASS